MKNKLFKNKTKGFSLVELIVVIAIMAVLAAVLAPALLSYVEKSRAQKDDSAFSEVTNATQLALSDQDVYDELLEYSVSGNKSCYVDSDDPKNAITTKKGNTEAGIKDQIVYGDENRKLDEKQYTAAGCMRGVTITFTPNNTDPKVTTFDLANARINEIVKGTPNTGAKTGTLGDNNKEGVLYNALRAVIGDTIKSTSQTYRNSNYTIFIYMGSTGGKQASAQDAIKVYGQWSGTNIAADDTDSETPSGGNQTSPTLASGAVIPEGCSYTPSGEAEITADGTAKMPVEPSNGDVFKDADYVYTFESDTDGWLVNVAYVEHKDKYGLRFESINKDKYGLIFESINGKQIKSMHGTFESCTLLTTAPEIPKGVTDMRATFYGCTSLTTAPVIPNGVTNMYYTFSDCTSLTTAPKIPKGVTNMRSTFYNCSSLTTAPTIPDNVTNMISTFNNCTSLANNIVINANPTSYSNCFANTTKAITITGNCSSETKSNLANTSTGNVS